MKYLIIISLLISVKCLAQSNTDRINALEKWSTQAKAQLKADSIAIKYLKAGKTSDSLQINLLNAQQLFLQNSITQLNASITKIISDQASILFLTTTLKDTTVQLRKDIPTYLNLYIDTITGLNFKKDTLYIKK